MALEFLCDPATGHCMGVREAPGPVPNGYVALDGVDDVDLGGGYAWTGTDANLIASPAADRLADISAEMRKAVLEEPRGDSFGRVADLSANVSTTNPLRRV